MIAAATLACLATSACNRVPREAPQRATNAISVPPQVSVIDVPITASLAQVSAALERAVPRALWSIDQAGQTCAASRKVKVLFAKIKTPKITCRIVGTVTRGRMTISGRGRDLFVTMPIHASISARDVGGILRQETATADARVRAIVQLDLAPNWAPSARVAISYDWTDEPHIDFLGQRIEFTSRADARLKAVTAQLERTLPGELRKLRLREQVAAAWSGAFTSVSLNRANPPVWMRIAPQGLTFGGYSIDAGRLRLQLGMRAGTETFVGARPQDPVPTPLPNFERNAPAPSAILFAIPVIADYAQLEPVLTKALTKRSARPFEVPGIGLVRARFGKVAAYGTEGGRIAVGLTFTASAPGGSPSRGTVWLAARPVNAENSRVVRFAELSVVGVTDPVGTGLLIRLANTPGVSKTIAGSLTQNFARDYDQLIGKVGRAIEEKRLGNLLIRARISDIRTGQIAAAGQGVYLPVWGKGTASISLEQIR